MAGKRCFHIPIGYAEAVCLWVAQLWKHRWLLGRCSPAGVPDKTDARILCVFWTFMVLSWDVNDQFLLLCFRRTTNKTKGLNFVRRRGLVKYPRSVPHQCLCASHGALETRNSSDVPESLVWSNWSSLQLPKKSLSTFHKVSLMLRRKSLLVEQMKCLLHSKPPLALVEKAF